MGWQAEPLDYLLVVLKVIMLENRSPGCLRAIASQALSL